MIAGVISFLPPTFSFGRFLSFPGVLLTLLVFGTTEPDSPLIRLVADFAVWWTVSYFVAAAWTWNQLNPTRPTPTAVKIILAVWFVLLLPWLVIASLSGMAFDGGKTAEAYVFVWSVLSYPITVGLAAVFRRWLPWMVLLPLVNVAGCGASELLHK